MTDEEKVTNGRNSRGSHQLRNNDFDTHINIAGINGSVIKTAEEKLQEVNGNALRSPDIEPSIYQTGVVGEITTAAPTEMPPAEGSSEEAAPADVTPEGAPPTETEPPQPPAESEKPPDQQTDVEGQEPKKEPSESEEKAESAEKTDSADKTETSEKAEESGESDATKATQESEMSGETGEKKVEEKGEESKTEGEEAKSTSGVSPTTEATTTPPPKEPYQIDIPIDRKINKRTQKKLWEEIERRKPLIPKYVERHIQKYAKPPFELWGCKFRGKGSCYGCGG